MIEKKKVKFSKQPKPKPQQFTGKYYSTMKPLKDALKKGNEVLLKISRDGNELWFKPTNINLNTEKIAGKSITDNMYVRCDFHEVNDSKINIVQQNKK